MLVLESGDKLRGDASAAAVVDYTIHGIIGSIPTQFADGQLAAIIGDLYTSAGIVIVASITLVNTDSVARTVNLYLTPSGGTARRLIAKDLSLAAGYSLMFDGNKFEVIDTFGQIATTRTSALIGPAASTDMAVVRFSGTTGKLAQDSTGVTIDNSNNMTVTGNLIFAGAQKIIGGTGTTSDLSLQTTSGVGAAGADMHFLIGNNGATEAMTILNSGNVGIGTAAPNNQLHLYKTSGDATLKLESDSAGRGIITIDGTRTVDDLLSTIVTSNAGDTVASISVGREGANDAGYMAFATQKTGEGNTERMRIDSAGNVGIGTAAPGAKVDVRGVGVAGDPTDAGTTAAILVTATGGSTNQGGEIRFGYGAGTFTQPYFAAIKGLGQNGAGNTQGDIGFYTRNAQADTSLMQRVLITQEGNVGIGTASPGANFDVIGAGGGNVFLIRTLPGSQGGTDGQGAVVFKPNYAAGVLGIQGSNNQLNAVANIAIQAEGGNVGIGTADPKTPFQTHFAADINLMFTSDATHAIISAANDANNANIPFALYGTTILLSGVTTISAATFLTGLGAASAGTTMVLVAGTNEVRPLLSSKEFKDEITVAKTPGITDLTVKQFKWKESQELDYGLIAEEAAEVCPVIVNFYEGKPISIKWATLTALLLEKVQTLEKRIEQLEKK